MSFRPAITGHFLYRFTRNAKTALNSVNSAIIHAMVQGVPSLKAASSNDEIIPLPYCNAPISAEAEPAMFGTASNAAAVYVAAIMPFI